MTRLHETFEWDEAKADANLRKHRVSFEDAAEVLSDEAGDRFQLDVLQEHDEELRWKTYAADPMDRSVVWIIVWAERIHTRIITARLATSKEKRFYEQNL